LQFHSLDAWGPFAPLCTPLETVGQVRNQLGTPGGAEFSESGPNFLNYV